MHVIPPWAPNAHPMLVHFPIVLMLLAVLVDGVRLVRPRAAPAWSGGALYGLGALAAAAVFASGWLAARSVRIPGMAHGLVEDHRSWALVTTGAIIAAALFRLGSRSWRRSDGRGTRVLLVVLSLALAVLVQQTAERGARLVYEQGVGVIGPAYD